MRSNLTIPLPPHFARSTRTVLTTAFALVIGCSTAPETEEHPTQSDDAVAEGEDDGGSDDGGSDDGGGGDGDDGAGDDGGGDDGGGDNGGGDDGGSGGDSSPSEDNWITTDEYMSYDDCNMAEYVSDGPGSTLVVAIDGSDLSITHGRGTESCVLQGDVFECEPRTDTDDTPSQDYGLDAVIVLEMAASGGFEGSDLLEMITEVEVECDGDDCWAVELATAEMPCSMAVVLEAEPQ